MTNAISYQDWSDYLLRIGAICEPAELQGMAIGYVCAEQAQQSAGQENKIDWMTLAVEFMDLIEGQNEGDLTDALFALLENCTSALAADDYQLQLLLPDDALPLYRRVDCLAKWCSGFLHGLAAAGEGIAARLDETAKESLHDIANMAQASNEPEADDESEEAYFVELVEYVRLAIFNLYGQLRGTAQSQIKTTH